ncbi:MULTISPECIES: SAF domain-containing protein [Micromonospora]|uniref:Flagellar biosynthesis protein FlgA n=1 Tax=Micromonospora maris TaxID=1003110 RepID=A0A9X0I6E7_9ACTN|nr:MULTISPECIES: SAF domain-containing protein [Micromonospora]AEB42238.1 SAF domain-containing protein [Micromonospora maris AB-18-032]KUJ47742.1 flagellar biosynthesis protein FlgA [Micromonospora maris]RUL90948.1 flagellar biosynthesis protein FlgA [Verrucosispora sp. FIM060022]
MSVATRNGPSPVDAPVAPPKVVRQRRVRPGLLGLAVLLIALGGLGSAFAVTSVRATGSYLAVARTVEVGSVVSASDLVSVQVAGGQGLDPVPAGRLADVVGMRAAVSLAPGTLLTMAQLTDQPLLGPGQQQIALGLRTAQVPAPKLRPGDQVLLVSTPRDDSSSGSSSGVTRFTATVTDAVSTDGRDEVVVYLALAVRDVPAVVAMAAQDRIAVVLTKAA